MLTGSLVKWLLHGLMTIKCRDRSLLHYLCMEQCRENYNMDALLFTNLCSDTCFKPSDLCIVSTPYIIYLWSTIMLICWLLVMCWIIPSIHWFAQEWSEVEIRFKGELNGTDCASANLLKFEHDSKHSILILGGWQSSNEVVQDMWKFTEEDKQHWSFKKQNLKYVEDVSL